MEQSRWMPGWRSWRLTPGAAHRLLYIYNVIVVAGLACFMAETQAKILRSMSAYSFLSSVPALPWPIDRMMTVALGSLAALMALGWVYRHARTKRYRYAAAVLETGCCLLLMRSLNLSYDGVVLLVVADLIYHYAGRHQTGVLLVTMLVLYFLANYNLAWLSSGVVPFASYAAYYAPAVARNILAAQNVCASLNMVLFVLYLVLLVRSQHEERRRIAELNARLGAANERLRAYASQAATLAETRERNRLAREIHDTLGHALTGIVAGLDACIMTLDTAPEFTLGQLRKIRDIANRGIVDVRRSVKKLRPDDLEKLPLMEAIVRLTEGFAMSSGMHIELTAVSLPEHLRPDEEDVIYRIVQEGITNANRHGQARNVRIAIGRSVGQLIVLVRDDGTGIPPGTPEGFGLRHMRERLGLLGGRLDYENGPTGGLVLRATLPVHMPATQAAALSQAAEETGGPERGSDK